YLDPESPAHIRGQGDLPPPADDEFYPRARLQGCSVLLEIDVHAYLVFRALENERARRSDGIVFPVGLDDVPPGRLELEGPPACRIRGFRERKIRVRILEADLDACYRPASGRDDPSYPCPVEMYVQPDAAACRYLNDSAKRSRGEGGF